MREMLCRTLDDAGIMTIPAGTASDAAKLFRLNDPDGALIDIDLGAGPNGLMLAARLRRDAPALPLVFLTVRTDPRAISGPPIPANAHFVQKKGIRDIDDLVAVIDNAMRGATAHLTRHDKTELNPLASLTQAQLDVLRLIAEGFTNEQIAATRGTTLRATELLVKKTLLKVGIDGQAGNRRVLAARQFV